jgi:hypothetical protein
VGLEADEGEECGMCLEELALGEGEEALRGCAHVFHSFSLHAWAA